MGEKGKMKKNRNVMTNRFGFFKQAVSNVFESLFRQYDFAHVSTTVETPDCVIKHWNRTTGLDITYELESSITVDLIQLERTLEETLERRSYDLLLLMELRRPDIDRTQFYGGDKEWSNDYVEKLLREYARFLKEDAHDVLSGDFTIFPELTK